MLPAILAAASPWVTRWVFRAGILVILAGDGPFPTTVAGVAYSAHQGKKRRDLERASAVLHDPLHQYRIPDGTGAQYYVQ